MARRQSILEQATEIARRRFGYDALRPEQAAAIESIMSGTDTWVNLRTGAGKSAIYQIPACMTSGLVIVFSPLIALMKDQVEKLRSWGINAARLSADMPEYEVRRTIARMNKLDILYIAPERLKSSEFLRRVRDVDVAIVVLDEAHVLSQSMMDFRPAYKLIGKLLRRYLPDVPRLALTATADDYVERDVARVLGMEEYNRVTAAPDRPNLKFEVVRDQGTKDIARWIRLNDFHEEGWGAGIIYASTRRRVMEIAGDLRAFGINVEPYHAGLPGETRNEVQERWISGQTPIMVATCAFGMGVDKPDVRFVYHADPPGSIFEYAQEAGRAGRDGEESVCVLNMTQKALKTREFFIRTANPPLDYYQRVWDNLSKHPVKKAFRLSTFDVAKWLKEYGVNPYDAGHYVRSILSYLEYIEAITTKPDRVVHNVVVKNLALFAPYLRKYEDNIELKEGNEAVITIYPGDHDFVDLLLAKKIVDREHSPIEVFRALREREDHRISSFELDEKRRAAQTRLDLLVAFSNSDDKHEFLRKVFSRKLVEQVKVDAAPESAPVKEYTEKPCPSPSPTASSLQQPLLPWESAAR